MEKIININTNYKKFFKQYLVTVRPLLKPRIIAGELDVLGEIMYLNYTYRDLPDKIKDKIMLSYDDKMAIISNISISYSTFSNIITSLRKKGYLKGNKLVNTLCIVPDGTYNITYKFIIDGVESK